jgi:hypothetical protein
VTARGRICRSGRWPDLRLHYRPVRGQFAGEDLPVEARARGAEAAEGLGGRVAFSPATIGDIVTNASGLFALPLPARPPLRGLIQEIQRGRVVVAEPLVRLRVVTR